ncbi:MAG TPA: glycogen synthase GlgA [Chromatiaceae bacterium]|nr:glycogen synthase GlgA [Chromatiaceae bacterium]
MAKKSVDSKKPAETAKTPPKPAPASIAPQVTTAAASKAPPKPVPSSPAPQVTPPATPKAPLKPAPASPASQVSSANTPRPVPKPEPPPSAPQVTPTVTPKPASPARSERAAPKATPRVPTAPGVPVAPRPGASRAADQPGQPPAGDTPPDLAPLALDLSEMVATAPSLDLLDATEIPSAPAAEVTPVPGPATVEPLVAASPAPMSPAPVSDEVQVEATPPAAESEAEPESVHILEPYPEQSDTSQAPSPYVYQGPSLYIVQITPEMAPVAKVGGLGDVVFGLTRELAIRGNHVEIILPKYDNLRYDHIYELHVAFQDLWVPWYEGAIHCTVYFGFVHDRKCFFIEPHSPDNFFNRGAIYGFNDDLLRYAFFSRAAMEFLFKAGKHPDIIHCHDWQTALVPLFLFEIYQHLGMTHPRVCLTIHNFKHQGVTGQELLRATGLGRPEHFFDYSRLRDNHNPHALNLLKGGIVYANFTTTVSPRYAFETRDGGQGFGLEPTLHTHHLKYGGVVNGIDYDVWNPEVDRYLPVRYGLDTLDGKYDNKRALRHRFLLADNAKPIIAFIGRLDPQKGLELVRHAIFYSLEHGAQFVLLGSSPDARINADFWGLKRMLNDSPDCHLEIGYDEELSHLIYAGADMLLVPSQFEPCGLTQLIALRYGTIPVVRAVGGLADTVYDKDYSHRPLHERNGYVFENYDQPGLESALGRAIACYYQHPDHFRELMKNAMRSDYSWNIPGMDYLNIYNYIRDK